MAHHTIIIYLNVQHDADGRPTGMLDGYQYGDEVTPVFAYSPEGKDDYTPAMLAEDAFRIFNAPQEYLSPADVKIEARYRANKLRSLSVGDIVMVDGEVFAVAVTGWRRIEEAVPPNASPNPFDNF